MIIKKNMSLFHVDDVIKVLNGQRVTDILDFRFYLQENNKIHYQRKENTYVARATEKELKKLDFVEDIPGIRTCQNKCIFCFIDQLPKGLRKTLYFKDDDWRLSFLAGNFITLTNVSEDEADRIIEQRISPLYVSLHATDKDVRKRLIGSKITDEAFKTLKKLDANRISLHIQIVVCPGFNDGDVLKKTFTDLKRLSNIETIGLVPVGLTRFHNNDLEYVGSAQAKTLIRFVEKEKQETDDRLYLADEFYLLAGADIPEARYYGEFEQLENGIGLVRKWIDGLNKQEIPQKGCFTIVTGEAFEQILVNQLKSGTDKQLFDIQGIKNKYFGPKINVTGLLTAQDILNQVKPQDTPILIPDIVLNENRLFLDDMSEEQFKKRLPSAQFVPTDSVSFCSWLKNLAKSNSRA